MNLNSEILSWALPVLLTVLAAISVIVLIRRTLPDRTGNRVKSQLLQVAVVLFALVILALVVPLEDTTQGQLLSLFGLLITGVIGLASTSFVSNAMSGFMLRSVASFHAGDFIRVDEHFGRVTETALLHTEIQSEDRDLITLPNLYLITKPVRVVRSSGTLISADVSLGYDIDRRYIRELLVKAAEDAGLAEAFIQITQLGDYSVNYRVSGFLEQVNSMVSKRTELRARMLDRLHGGGVEIMSPSFMNQRPVDPSKPVIPVRHWGAEDDAEELGAERIMFDKAEMAARIQKLRQQHEQLETEIKGLKDTEDDSNSFEIHWRELQLKSIEQILETLSPEPMELN